jgi:hypothetical protein
VCARSGQPVLSRVPLSPVQPLAHPAALFSSHPSTAFSHPAGLSSSLPSSSPVIKSSAGSLLSSNPVHLSSVQPAAP